MPDDIVRRRREEERNREAASKSRRVMIRDFRRTLMFATETGDIPGSEPPTPTTRAKRSQDRMIRSQDVGLEYMKADDYLAKLAEKSGGRLLRADTLVSLPDAFSQIAAELRTQYLLGYYPTNKQRDERIERSGSRRSERSCDPVASWLSRDSTRD